MTDYAIHVFDFVERLEPRDIRFATMCNVEDSAPQRCAPLNFAAHVFACGLAWQVIHKFHDALESLDAFSELFSKTWKTNALEGRNQLRRVQSRFRQLGKLVQHPGNNRLFQKQGVFASAFSIKEFSKINDAIQSACKGIDEDLEVHHEASLNQAIGGLKTMDGTLQDLLERIRDHYENAENSMQRSDYASIVDLHSLNRWLGREVSRMVSDSGLWHSQQVGNKQSE